MFIDPKFSLTDSQKTCLRLVERGMTSKEIARDTGLSPFTVDTYIKRAMTRLGASNRREAARMLAKNEESQNLGSPLRAVAEHPDFPIFVPSSPQGESTGTTKPVSRRYGVVPALGGQINELGWADRHYAFFKVGALGLSVISALTLVTAGILWAFD